jgi:hypothetical protein
VKGESLSGSFYVEATIHFSGSFYFEAPRMLDMFYIGPFFNTLSSFAFFLWLDRLSKILN